MASPTTILLWTYTDELYADEISYTPILLFFTHLILFFATFSLVQYFQESAEENVQSPPNNPCSLQNRVFELEAIIKLREENMRHFVCEVKKHADGVAAEFAALKDTIEAQKKTIAELEERVRELEQEQTFVRLETRAGELEEEFCLASEDGPGSEGGEEEGLEMGVERENAGSGRERVEDGGEEGNRSKDAGASEEGKGSEKSDEELLSDEPPSQDAESERVNNVGNVAGIYGMYREDLARSKSRRVPISRPIFGGGDIGETY